MKTNYLKPFPIAEPNQDTHDTIVQLSENLHKINKTLNQTNGTLMDSKKNMYEQEKILSLRKLNRVVYKLYGLNENDIKIIEENV